MNGKQAKRARSAANAEAQRRGLWKKGEADIYAKWWRKLFAAIFLPLRRKYSDIIGRWYKRTLKDWSRQVYAFAHNGGKEEAEYLERKRARINRKFQAELRQKKAHA